MQGLPPKYWVRRKECTLLISSWHSPLHGLVYVHRMDMAWLPSSEAKSTRMLLCAYSIVVTLFCLRFIQRLKTESCTYTPPPPSISRNNSGSLRGFPRKIWQTSKMGPGGLEDDDRKAIQSWVKLNQKHRYEILTQHSAESYVRNTFPHRYDIEETFMDLADPILRADLIRYLVLL